MSNKTVLTFKEYLRQQMEQILSPDNKWFAGEKLNRTPTVDEAAEHFVAHGGAENFANQYSYEVPSKIKMIVGWIIKRLKSFLYNKRG